MIIAARIVFGGKPDGEGCMRFCAQHLVYPAFDFRRSWPAVLSVEASSARRMSKEDAALLEPLPTEEVVPLEAQRPLCYSKLKDPKALEAPSAPSDLFSCFYVHKKLFRVRLLHV